MTNQEKQEKFHHEAGTHPGKDWEWMTNRWGEDDKSDHKIGVAFVVKEAYDTDGNLMEGHCSVWKRKGVE